MISIPPGIFFLRGSTLSIFTYPGTYNLPWCSGDIFSWIKWTAASTWSSLLKTRTISSNRSEAGWKYKNELNIYTIQQFNIDLLGEKPAQTNFKCLNLNVTVYLFIYLTSRLTSFRFVDASTRSLWAPSLDVSRHPAKTYTNASIIRKIYFRIVKKAIDPSQP